MKKIVENKVISITDKELAEHFDFSRVSINKFKKAKNNKHNLYLAMFNYVAKGVNRES